MMRIKIIEYFIYFSILILNILLIIISLYFRYLIEKLPKTIPFELTLIGFYSILFLCFLFLIRIYNIYFKRKHKNPIEIILDFFMNPFYDFFGKIDQYWKKRPFIKNTLYDKILIPYMKCYSLENLPYLIYIEFFLRMILLMTFLIDVFYFSELFYTYKVIIISIVLVFIKYIVYTLNGLINDMIEQLNVRIEIFTSDTKNPFLCLPIIEFLKQQAIEYKKNKIFLEYTPSLKLDYLAAERLRLNLDPKIRFNYAQMKKDIRGVIKTCFNLYYMIYLYYINRENVIYKILNTIINVSYLLGWSYILYISEIPLANVSLLNNFQDYLEPFSQTLIHNNENKN